MDDEARQKLVNDTLSAALRRLRSDGVPLSLEDFFIAITRYVLWTSIVLDPHERDAVRETCHHMLGAAIERTKEEYRKSLR